MKLIKTTISLFCIIANIMFICIEERVNFMNFAIALIFFSIASFAHLLMHEIGHLVGGILTGYRLILFQVGPVNLIADQSSRLSLSLKNSHGGQCIMSPSQRTPLCFRAYNLGGIIANSITCVIGFTLLLPDLFPTTLFFIELLFSGILKIVSNCLPHLNNGLPNDGFIVKLLNHNKEVQKDYITYLTLYAALFWEEDIPVSNFEYQRTTTTNEYEMLYYRGIQELLNAIEKADEK